MPHLQRPNDRAFSITPARGVCFGKCKKGGGAISLAACVRQRTLREAAEFLSGKIGASVASSKDDNSKEGSPKSGRETGLKPLEYLQAGHEAVQNISALQLEQLAALMDERKCGYLEIF